MKLEATKLKLNRTQVMANVEGRRSNVGHFRAKY
jgi:hypothetical protein